jgi:hypothetical protein
MLGSITCRLKRVGDERARTADGALQIADLVYERVHPHHEIAPYGGSAVREEEVTGEAAERRTHHGPQHNHGAFVIHTTLQAGLPRRNRLQALCHGEGKAKG